MLTNAYDANGNMITRAGSIITWTDYNYPTAISASDATGSEEVQFSYGPERQRWEQIYTGPSGTEQTYYIGGLIDLVFNGTTNYRQYIYAGAEPIAVYSRTGTGVNTMSYVLEDHQGGVSSITSNAGATDIDESFSAFGTRRNPTSWSGAPTTADLNTIASLSRQGYTFQTWLGQSMGLNHMNGRVQDANLGRFLSPDPHIPDPSNAQSYNRYSYVNNNPLTMMDPTGFAAGLPLSEVPENGGDNFDGDFMGDWESSGMDLSLSQQAQNISAENAAFAQLNANIAATSAAINEYAASLVPTDSSLGAALAGDTTSSTGLDGTGAAGQSSAMTQTDDTGGAQSGDPLSPVVVTATTLLAEITVTSTYTGDFNFAALGRALVPYNPAAAAGQFLVGSAGLGAGFALSPVYAGVGATFGAIGAGKASNGDPTSILMGAGLGSLTGGSTAAAGDAIGATGLGGAALVSAFGGLGAGGTMATMNLLTGQPVTINVGYATTIGALGPLASGEAMLIGGAGYAGNSALGYILNVGTSGFTTALGP